MNQTIFHEHSRAKRWVFHCIQGPNDEFFMRIRIPTRMAFIYTPLDGCVLTKQLNHKHRNCYRRVQKANHRSPPALDIPLSRGQQSRPLLSTRSYIRTVNQ